MSWVIQVLGAILAIFSIILIHELGHFLIARWLDVKVLRFSIGFGKALYRFRSRAGIEYVLAAIPLGGYVKMLNKEDHLINNSTTTQARCFEEQALWKRFLIIIAGPISNFILAILLWVLIFTLGFSYIRPVIGEVFSPSIASQAGVQHGDEILRVDHQQVYGWQDVSMQLLESVGDQAPVIMEVKRGATKQSFSLMLNQLTVTGRQFDILEAIGIVPYFSPGPAIIMQIMSNSPAAKAGLRVGDQIVQIGKQPVQSWYQALRLIRQSPQETLRMQIYRKQDGIHNIVVSIGQHMEDDHPVGFLGIAFKIPSLSSQMIVKRHENLLSAWGPAVHQVYVLTLFNVNIILKMLKGDIGLNGLSGPVGILQTAGAASQAGVQTYLAFIALISVALGFANLLPIPILDGGHLLILSIELVIRRPVPANIQKILWFLGSMLLIILLFYATYNDILHILIKN